MTQRNLPETLSEKASLEGPLENQEGDAGDSERPQTYANPHEAQFLWKARPLARSTLAKELGSTIEEETIAGTVALSFLVDIDAVINYINS